MRGRIPSGLRASAIALLAGATFAQIQLAQPAEAAQQAAAERELVVGPGGARLHSGPSERMYTVATLQSGETLRIVGEERGMLAVAYPPSVSAYVPAESVLREGGGRVTLVEPSRLIALHATRGPDGSWNSLLEEPIDAGTTLTVRGAIRGDDGSVVGYRIEPPRGAIAFVDPDSLHEPGQRPEPSEDEPDTAPQDEEASDAAAEREDADDASSLLEPVVAPGEEPQSSETPAGATENEAGQSPDEASDDDPVVVDQSRPAEGAQEANEADPGERQVFSLAELDRAYDDARASGWDDAELGALLEEHRRALEEIEVSPLTERTRLQLRQRIAFLEMRIRYREGPGRLAREREGAPSLTEQMRERIKELEADAAYLVVGRLVPSRVYDGERLPRLYRLESADTLGRTLGYLEPDRDLELQEKLGEVVGIIGAYEQDEDSPMRMIRPTHVKRLGKR